MRNAYLPALIGCLLWNVPSTARAAFLPVRSGEIARYRLTYHGEGTINFRMLMGQQAGAPDTMASDLQAQMEIVQVTPGTFAVRLIAPAYQLRVNGQTPDLSRAVAALTEPCYLTVDSAGRIRSLSFAPETPAAMRTLLRAVLSDLQFARPAAGANSRQWKTQQDTANGAADVAYRALDAATYEKRICAYPVTRQIGPKGTPGLHHETQGALRFTFAEGRLRSVGGALTTRSTVTGRLVSEAKERFTLARIGAGSESPDTLRRWDADRRAQSRAEVPTPLSAPDRDVAGQRASWTQILGSTTTESLLADLRTLDASGAKNDAGLFTKLCALFNLRPKATRDIAAGLSSANPDQISLRLAVAAMGEAASEAAPDAAAAEQTLREMLSTRRAQPDAVLFLAPALASAQVPQPETLRLLQTVAQDNNPDIAMPAALAMGRLAHACPPAMARSLVRFLTQRLATSGEALRVPLLAALGNAGSAESLAAVAAYTQSSSPLLRGAAYLNLRFVPGERVMTLIQRGLSDPDSGVRLSAARALQFRPFSARDLQVVANALAKEGTDSVRLALLENVNLEAPYYPQATRSILGRASTKDASAEIRRTVSGWLRPAQG